MYPCRTVRFGTLHHDFLQAVFCPGRRGRYDCPAESFQSGTPLHRPADRKYEQNADFPHHFEIRPCRWYCCPQTRALCSADTVKSHIPPVYDHTLPPMHQARSFHPISHRNRPIFLKTRPRYSHLSIPEARSPTRTVRSLQR